MFAMARQQQDAEKSTREKERSRKVRDISPYSKNFKCYIKSDERDLIYKRQTVIKLSRKDLEDKYIELCDENFFMKRHNNELHDRIKELTAKIVRLSSTHRCFSTSAILKERTTENVTETSRTDPRYNASYTKPIIRSSSLSNMCKRHLKSAPLSDGFKSNSSSTDSQKFLKRNDTNQGTEQKSEQEKGLLESPEKNINKIEGNLVALQKRIVQLTEEVKAEQEKCAQILKEKEELEKNFSDLDMRKYLESSVETNRLKRKLGELVCFTKRMQTDFKVALCEKDHLLEIERAKYNSMIERLKTEEASESKNLLMELKSALKNVDLLTKTVSELENDKKLLLDQQQSFSNLIKETTLSRETKVLATPPEKPNADLMEKLNELKAEKSEIKATQNELISKVKELQDTNSKLLVELEEIKITKQHSDKMTPPEDDPVEETAATQKNDTLSKTGGIINETTSHSKVLTNTTPEKKDPGKPTMAFQPANNDVQDFIVTSNTTSKNIILESMATDVISVDDAIDGISVENTNQINKTSEKKISDSPADEKPRDKKNNESQTVDTVTVDKYTETLQKQIEESQPLSTVNASSQTNVREVVVVKSNDGEVSDSEVTNSEALDSLTVGNGTVASEIEDGEVEEGEIVAIALRIAITR